MDISKSDIVTSMRINLEKAHVKGIPDYIRRLQANYNSAHFYDFCLEGEAALMFAKAGFYVKLRESPDLALRFNNEELYAEVKHFEYKEQNDIDAAKMSESGDLLVPYGDIFPLEGRYAHEQVYDVAKKKITQYKEHVPNILVIESSSTSIEDIEIPNAIDKINEDVRSEKCLGLAKLNGILLAEGWYNISRQWRNVSFYPTCKPAVPFSRELSLLLDNILLG
jgi:hypothetical protein